MIRLVTIIFFAGVALALQKAPQNKGDGMRFLSGTVTDQDNRPIPHAAVQIEDTKTLQIRSYISETHGEFHFAELSGDRDYDVSAEFDGLRSPKKTLSQFDEKSHPVMTLIIHLPKLK